MSIGIGVRAELLSQDDDRIVFKYGSFNWNLASSRNPEYDMDGLIVIKKQALPIIEFQKRNSKKSNSKRARSKESLKNTQHSK